MHRLLWLADRRLVGWRLLLYLLFDFLVFDHYRLLIWRLLLTFLLFLFMFVFLGNLLLFRFLVDPVHILPAPANLKHAILLVVFPFFVRCFKIWVLVKVDYHSLRILNGWLLWLLRCFLLLDSQVLHQPLLYHLLR